jgi:enamine deaminase RidA (YjgF/YER057c/UK114 family)
VSGIERFGGDPPSPFEDEYSFSRLARAGGFVLVGGTTAVDQHGAIHGATPYEQTAVVLEKVLRELARMGAGAEDVVQCRIYVADISRAAEVGRAFSETFGSVRPLMTMVEVSALIDPRMLVEIETVACP